jgi:hypothetical protein
VRPAQLLPALIRKRGTVERTPNPARPRGEDGSVHAVEKLDLETVVLHLEGADSEPPIKPGATHLLPSDEALGPGDLVRGHPQEGAMEPVNGG